MRSSRRKVRVLVALAMLLGSFLPAIAATQPTAGKERNPWRIKLLGEAEAEYNDNILMLSDVDIDSMDDPASGSNPLEVFGIDEPEDFVFVPSLGLSLNRSPESGGETTIGLSARSNQYEHSTVKNYQEYGFSVKQELNRSRTHRTVLTVGGSRTPFYFLRNLLDEDESASAMATIRNAATFEKNRGYIEISQEIVNKVLSATGGYARERRNYNPHFDERDASSDVTTLEVDVYPARSLGFRIKPYFRHEKRGSRGDLGSTSIVDDDVGFDADRYGIELRGLWGRDRDHRNTLRAFYESERKTYATSSILDPAHFGREDDVTKYGVGYSRELGPRWQWGLRAHHRNVDINIFTGRFDRTVVTASFGYNFDHRLGFSREAREDDD